MVRFNHEKKKDFLLAVFFKTFNFIHLADNRISERGAEALSSALEYNQTLVLLSLRGS